MYKRPALKQVRPKLEFVSQYINGALVSSWQVVDKIHIIPTGTPGRVGEIVTKMDQNTAAQYSKPEWVPPYDYEFVIKNLPVEQQDAYRRRCEEWHNAHPPPPPKPPKEKLNINTEVVANFWKNKKEMPTLKERVEMLREAGYPDEKIDKCIAWYEKDERLKDERQAAIDRIFGQYKGAKTKKVVKVIKPVKKKIT